MVFSHSDEPRLGGREQGCLTNCSKLKSDHTAKLFPWRPVIFSIKSNLVSMSHEASFDLNPALLPNLCPLPPLIPATPPFLWPSLFLPPASPSPSPQLYMIFPARCTLASPFLPSALHRIHQKTRILLLGHTTQFFCISLSPFHLQAKDNRVLSGVILFE